MAVRFVHFGAIFFLFGGPFFFAYAGRTLPATLAALPATTRAVTRWLAAAAVVAAASGLLWIWGSLAMIAGTFAGALDPDLVRPFLFATPFGPFELVRVGLFAVLLATVIVRIRPSLRFPLLSTTAAGLLASQAWLGHAAEGGHTTYGFVMIAVYIVHVIAAAAWIGGLPALLAALIERRRQPGGLAAGSEPTTLGMLVRFSAMATGAAAAVILSGAANTYFRAGLDAHALLASRWGHVLGVKLLLVALVLALAAYNRFAAMPRLNRTDRKRAGGTEARLHVSIAAELAFAVLILAAAALLGITPPPK